MCECTLAIYCFIDDLLKFFGHKQDPRAQVTDSEVITIALVATLYFGGNFERSRFVLFELGFVPRLLSRSHFSRRITRLLDLIHCLFYQLGAVLKSLHWESHSLLDSFPIPFATTSALSVAGSCATYTIAEKSARSVVIFTA